MRKLSVSLFLLLIVFLTIQTVSATETDDYSINWSGYVATAPTPFTSASATWEVPTISSSSPAYSAVWVGIGGYYISSNKLIQAGTEQDYLSSGPSYYAWVEIYPKAPVTIGSVSAGDTITVTISKNVGNPPSWHIKMTKTQGTSTPITLIDQDQRVKTNRASEASAEFIVERPLNLIGHQLLPLAEFGSVTFSNCKINQVGLGLITDFTMYTMTSTGTSLGDHLATPSDLSGNEFTIAYGT
jgi:hypothetical protein